MFTCPSCDQLYPENERYHYYLHDNNGKQFKTPQYACGRCIVKKEASGITDRASVPAVYEKAFEGEPPFAIQAGPARPYYPDCGE